MLDSQRGLTKILWHFCYYAGLPIAPFLSWKTKINLLLNLPFMAQRNDKNIINLKHLSAQHQSRQKLLQICYLIFKIIYLDNFKNELICYFTLLSYFSTDMLVCTSEICTHLVSTVRTVLLHCTLLYYSLLCCKYGSIPGRYYHSIYF